jgi:hypothetical protein
MVRPAALDAGTSRESLRDLAPLRRGGIFLGALAVVIGAPLTLSPLTQGSVEPMMPVARLDLRVVDPVARDAVARRAQARIADVWASETQTRLADAVPRQDDATRIARLGAGLIR